MHLLNQDTLLKTSFTFWHNPLSFEPSLARKLSELSHHPGRPQFPTAALTIAFRTARRPLAEPDAVIALFCCTSDQHATPSLFTRAANYHHLRSRHRGRMPPPPPPACPRLAPASSKRRSAVRERITTSPHDHVCCNKAAHDTAMGHVDDFMS